MKVHILSFGNTARFGVALTRLLVQSSQWTHNNQPIFSSFHFENEMTIQKKWPSFWETHGQWIINNPRGYGYWLWKPFLVHQTLLQIPENDILLYVDSGCQFNMQGIKRFNEYLEKAYTENNCCFLLDHKDVTWCKANTIKAIFGDQEFTVFPNQNQIMATVMFLKNTTLNQDFTHEWFSWCIKDNYTYLDDSNSQHVNHASFQDHRHDQAVFSLLYKKLGLGNAIPDETYWAPNWHSAGMHYPIWATRNPSARII